MNEETHYRSIPESEYQELKALAEGNREAILKVMDDSSLISELSEIKEEYRKTRRFIKEFSSYCNRIFHEIRSNEIKNNSSLRYYIEQLNKLKL